MGEHSQTGSLEIITGLKGKCVSESWNVEKDANQKFGYMKTVHEPWLRSSDSLVSS